MLSLFPIILALLISDPAISKPTTSDMKLVGTAKYYFGPFKLYDAALLSEDGRYSKENRFDLTLTYARDISATKLANASIIEMARLTGKTEEELEHLRSPLESCFGDVEKGVVITGQKLSADKTNFFKNGELTCQMQESDFSDAFFAIWLDPNGRYPSKTSSLIGK
ncbi:chalcone isomerase family protein [Hirschia baltica]|uniref:Chalcone isomerase domain-containing protein n=1 Tax=Hirschia baltica (strain ATCC 49814 / DSM 5838 / IFAM 1418) TaxID=582402 RepID=C6XIR7_HIRBI|nr:chalcone isomerase family protein [Hirschia baltica]ACT59012.1 conserved hypothetical protein [Hirschia baltica ATCC 49814]